MNIIIQYSVMYSYYLFCLFVRLKEPPWNSFISLYEMIVELTFFVSSIGYRVLVAVASIQVIFNHQCFSIASSHNEKPFLE